MQDSQTDTDKTRRVGVDEQFIKFRPSPNFKNMKKFLKSKIDIYTESNSSSPKPEQQTTSPEKLNDEAKPTVYPPLPLDPPPPDSPPDLNIKLKKEIEDIEYQTSPKEETTETMNNPELITEFKMDHTEEHQEKPQKPPICRDFIRGTCTRPGNCKYIHKFDPSQLVGVYIFCRNYQNSVCTYPNCRYVHATVFEEQRFYRTGILPPHALAHHKKVIQPPPPPPTETQGDLPSSFTNPPPPLLGNTDKPMPIINCIPSANMEARMEEDIGDNSQSDDVPKRDWGELEEFSSSPRDMDKETKCKNCEIMEFRLQYNKAKVENLIQSTESIDNKIGQIDKMNQRICTVLLSLMKRKNPIKRNGLSLPNIDEDMIKTRLETLNSLISPKSRVALSSVAVENNKNVLNGSSNLSTLMAKLLQRNGDQGASPDA